jgi:hypothetical protein
MASEKDVRLIAGQEMAQKRSISSSQPVGKYPPTKILMIGDAPGRF